MSDPGSFTATEAGYVFEYVWALGRKNIRIAYDFWCRGTMFETGGKGGICASADGTGVRSVGVGGVLAVRVARVLLRRSVRLPQVCYLDFPNYFHSEMVKA
ncbi:MAG: hypothetical protein Ct9H300mP25_04000 [Acidobacteriota bacterium]|nr:MAG: hypothetical protein Ct9H300mP25_04000 [Acidobacteriota bacterium]